MSGEAAPATPSLGSLASLARPLGAGEFARLRSHALARGVVVERDGLSVLGFGQAGVVPLPNGLGDPQATRAVPSSLAAIGPGVVAMGAFHFRPDTGVVLSVPSVCVRARAGTAPVAVVVAPSPTESAVDELLAEALAGGEPPRETPPDSFRLESRRPHEDFLHRVAAAVDEVRSGRLEKVVMAREVLIEANRPLRQGDLLERLRSLHPSCAAFAIDGFIGATPELLIRRSGREVESHPLAGTAARSGDPDADRRVEAALLASGKERSEHRAVVDAIADGLRPVMAELEVPDGPSIVELRNVSHLGTRMTGRLALGPAGELMNAIELLGLIHPTPAVAGSPVDLALDYLAKAEELDRDRYAGAVGWIDGDGDGEWYLGIRCAIVEDRTARLFAGVGIVADSDPHAELAETQLKLQAFLAAAVRP
ncbi:MAG TPA: isochorismate synthase [Acidimicrobiales bacterium]|nr:isochorismate synthase [Acidimicrobiales bacterium]